MKFIVIALLSKEGNKRCIARDALLHLYKKKNIRQGIKIREDNSSHGIIYSLLDENRDINFTTIQHSKFIRILDLFIFR